MNIKTLERAIELLKKIRKLEDTLPFLERALNRVDISKETYIGVELENLINMKATLEVRPMVLHNFLSELIARNKSDTLILTQEFELL